MEHYTRDCQNKDSLPIIGVNRTLGWMRIRVYTLVKVCGAVSTTNATFWKIGLKTLLLIMVLYGSPQKHGSHSLQTS